MGRAAIQWGMRVSTITYQWQPCQVCGVRDKATEKERKPVPELPEVSMCGGKAGDRVGVGVHNCSSSTESIQNCWHHAKWNKPDTEEKSTAWSHFYAESKKVANTEAMWMVVTRGGEGREMGRCWPKDTKFQLCRINTCWRANVQRCA